MSRKIPNSAKIIVVGGGIAGCSVAYHLAQLGHRDVILLERKTLTSGTTWHAAGLLAQLRANRTQTELAQYSLDLYQRLETETGQATGMRRNGTLLLAASQDRWHELKRRYSSANRYGIECHLLGAEEVLNHWALLEVEDLVGAVFVPGDGQIDPTGVTLALAKGARTGGVQIFENTPVNSVQIENNQVVAVNTDYGEIKCEILVNCCGMWAREFGRLANTNIPLQAVEHMYMITEPMPGLVAGIPSLRDYDGLTYFKEDAGKLIMGGTERDARPWATDKIPDDFEFTLLDEDWEQFEDLTKSAIHRVPTLADIGVRQLLNGPESFTPDGRYILGRCLETANVFVCAGFNSTGICASGGAGKALAEWITEGEPTLDLMDVDVRRFREFQGENQYLQQRASETVSKAFDMHWPYLQMESARGKRLSSIHGQLAERNACFGEAAGWERPNWFAPEDVVAEYEYSFGRQNWFGYSAAEHHAVRKRVGLIDVSSFTKFKISGRDALRFLQLTCTRNIDMAIDSVVYTLMLNHHGGIICDVTITRISDREFLLYCGAGIYAHVLGWMQSNLEADWNLSIEEVTSDLGVIAVMGPQSRNLLTRLSSTDLSNDAFPFKASREINIARSTCRASRVTFAGELGWELNVANQYLPDVYERLLQTGEDLGIQDVGYHALDSLRIERGYRHYGHDIGIFDTALEGGLGFAVDLNKTSEFIGREAFVCQKEKGLTRRLLNFTLQDPELILYHDEPIWCNGERVGEITSAAYGHTVGCAVALGYVNSAQVIDPGFIETSQFEIEIAAVRVDANASHLPPYDAKGMRVHM